MKILALGDLHAVKDWFAWTLEQIPRFDLVALPGDLLDCFGDIDAQKQFVAAWFSQAATFGVPIAWSTGNHDFTRWSFPHPDLRPGGCWTDQLRGTSIVGDFETKTFSCSGGKTYLVTCSPYTSLRSDPFEDRVARLLAEAAARRDLLGCPWILLNHEPPSRLALARGADGDLGDEPFRSRIEQHQPDIVLSGHVHEAPFHGPFWAKIGRTACFNPGCNFKASFPCHIVIDDEEGAAVFRYERHGQAQTEEALYRAPAEC